MKSLAFICDFSNDDNTRLKAASTGRAVPDLKLNAGHPRVSGIAGHLFEPNRISSVY
jgi:hypothetical protein